MTCKDCIHRDVCYKRESVPDENYAEKCGDFISDKVLEERPKGEWKITKAGYAKCPICKCEREVPENYCGYCGADMRGGAE